MMFACGTVNLSHLFMGFEWHGVCRRIRSGGAHHIVRFNAAVETSLKQEKKFLASIFHCWCVFASEKLCIAIRWIRTRHVDRMRCIVDELLVALQNDALIVCNRASVFHGCIAPRATNIYPSLHCGRTAKKRKKKCMLLANHTHAHTCMPTHWNEWKSTKKKISNWLTIVDSRTSDYLNRS